MAEAEAGEAGDAREDAPNPMALMGDILDKLKILGYEEFARKSMDGRLLHAAYFLVPHPKPNEQFHYFTQIFAFLMKLNKFSFEAPDEFDDPNSTVANIMEVREPLYCCALCYRPRLALLQCAHVCTPHTHLSVVRGFPANRMHTHLFLVAQALRRARITVDYSQVLLLTAAAHLPQ